MELNKKKENFYKRTRPKCDPSMFDAFKNRNMPNIKVENWDWFLAQWDEEENNEVKANETTRRPKRRKTNVKRRNRTRGRARLARKRDAANC